jgi:DNA-binding Lrp family transcriptional regulator
MNDSSYFVMFPSKYLEVLSARKCILMGVLIGLSKREGYAYPSNQTLSKIMNVSMDSIQRDLQSLEELKYIKRQVERNDKKEIISRKIYILDLTADLRLPLSADLRLPSPQKCGSNIDKSININKDISMFETIWNLYKKKGVKETAKKAFEKLSKDEIDLIQSHIPKYIDCHEKAEKVDFIPHLSTYLNQKRWNDELPYLPKKQIELTSNKPKIATL